MSASAFLALDRAAVLKLLSTTLMEMDDATLKTVSYLLISNYKPSLLAVPVAPVAPVAPVPVNEVVPVSEHNMRTSTDENVERLMELTGIDWESAWTELRCMELEDGDSICCTEECSDREEAIQELVEAARRGKQKRNARRKAAGRQVSEEEDSSKKPYIAPPKVRDAEKFWPFMRCKNVANALRTRQSDPPIPRNHHALLEHIAKVKRISVADLKKTDPLLLFNDNYYVMKVLFKSSRW
jgi:hypothetical protein